MKSTFLCLTLLLALLGGCAPADAQAIVDYSKGTVLFDDSITYDDATVGTSTYLFSNFFGTSFGSIDVNSNGNITVVGDISGQNVAMPDSNRTLRISPLWDDLIINTGDGGKVIENVDPDHAYYAVSWVNMETYPDSHSRQTFQAVLIGAPVTLQGFDFLADDIAFSYQTIDAPFADEGNPGATVGLDNGDGVNFVPLPGTTDGLIHAASELPLAPGAFVLFRPDGQGSYNASIQNLSAAPEPSPYMLIVIGASLLLLLALTKSRGRAKAKV